MSHSLSRAFVLSLVFLATLGAQQADPNLARGVALFEQGNFAAALEALEAAAGTHPDNARLENLIGLADTKLDRIDEADRHYRRASQLDAKFAAPRKNLGFNLLNRKQYAEAEKKLRSALALEPADSFTHYYLGLVYLSTARDKDAVEELDRAPELVANDRATEFQFALAYVRLGKTTEALAQFQKLAKERPDSFADQFNMAVAYLNAHQPQNAIAVLDPLRAQRPTEAGVLELIGSAHEQAGHSSQALDDYRAAVAADPRNPDTYLDYTRLLINQSRFSEATAFLQNGLNDVADPYGLYVRLGAIDLLNGKTIESRNWFERAIQLHPELALGYVALARSYWKEKANPEAERVLQDGMRRCPHDFMLQYSYGITAPSPRHLLVSQSAIQRSA